MRGQKLPNGPIEKLAAREQKILKEKEEWEATLMELRIIGERHVRIATEGALLGSVVEHGVNPGLAIVSDDAGQFNVLLHAFCWIHAERIFVKLVGFNDAQREALAGVRSVIWDFYADLKAYKLDPNEEKKVELDERFDELCATKTCFVSLNLALQRMHLNKAELLLVLDRPDVPLHNNPSENDIREYIKKRKISGSTRSDGGRRCRDTFTSLKKTCCKNGISFWEYLLDRLRGTGGIPALATWIFAPASPSPLAYPQPRGP
ncbi:MAG: transposase [Candidatus Schekmanbacteria bacterium]|nr:transposase [Candidatus Schekmanbacteria bacterium]